MNGLDSRTAEEPTTKRWVRYTAPVMVEVDCQNDKITRVVVLTDELREDRDDRGHFLIYDENFVRQSGDGPIEAHALAITDPGGALLQPLSPWPASHDWELDFDYSDETDELYDDIDPYATTRH